MSDIEQYNYRLVWSQPDAEWIGLCDAFPGLSWLEKDRQAALDGIRRMVGRALDILGEDGMAPPVPTPTGADAASHPVPSLQPGHRNPINPSPPMGDGP